MRIWIILKFNFVYRTLNSIKSIFFYQLKRFSFYLYRKFMWNIQIKYLTLSWIWMFILYMFGGMQREREIGESEGCLIKHCWKHIAGLCVLNGVPPERNSILKMSFKCPVKQLTLYFRFVKVHFLLGNISHTLAFYLNNVFNSEQYV